MQVVPEHEGTQTKDERQSIDESHKCDCESVLQLQIENSRQNEPRTIVADSSPAQFSLEQSACNLTMISSSQATSATEHEPIEETGYPLLSKRVLPLYSKETAKVGSNLDITPPAKVLSPWLPPYTVMDATGAHATLNVDLFKQL